MRRIVIICAVYPPEPVVSARMARDLAEHLVHDGMQVTVLCPQPSRPIGANYAELRQDGQVLTRTEAGVKVVRLPSYCSPPSRLLARMRESFSFGRHVCRYLRRHCGDADVVYANTWPLMSAALIARHCSKQRIPFVLHVQDVYPESLLEKLPGFCRKLVGFPLLTLDRWIARQATQVVTISQSMRHDYGQSRRIPYERLAVVSNWQDERQFDVLPNRIAACARYRVPDDRFTFLYFGNIGPVAGVDILIKAFHAARLPNAQLVIAGDGSAKADCMKLVQSMGTRDVMFVSDPDGRNVPLLQSLGHVCLLPLKRGAGVSSLPSKLIAYLLSGRPVIATVDMDSDTARCIREAGCGWIGEPENVQWLGRQLAEVAEVPEAELNKIGNRGREYALQHFSRAEGVRRLASLIADAGSSFDDASLRAHVTVS